MTGRADEVKGRLRVDAGTLSAEHEAVLTTAGDLDHGSPGPLREALAEALMSWPARVLVNSRDLRFCDICGAGVVLRVRASPGEALVDRPRMDGPPGRNRPERNPQR